MKSLSDKVAVVTGAGAGIGRALAIELAREGCFLALSDIDAVGLAETKEHILTCSPHAVVHLEVLDVCNQQAMLEYAKLIHTEFGRINVVINNAGVALSSGVDETKREDFTWLMNINFWGVVNGCEAFLPYLKQAPDAHIVNISSVFGMVGIPRQSSYNASKFAVRGYTEALIQEMNMHQPNINISCVHPGGVTTDILRHARISDKDNRSELTASFDKFTQTSPQKAAHIIVTGIKKNKTRIMVGWDAHLIHVVHRLLGIHYVGLIQWLAKRLNYQ